MKLYHQSKIIQVWMEKNKPLLSLTKNEFSAQILGIKVPFFVVTFKEGLEVFVVPHLSRSELGDPTGTDKSRTSRTGCV